MSYPKLDDNEIRRIIVLLFERWTGSPLNDIQQKALDDFMAEKVRPLKRLELMTRMGTPGDTLEWFLDYLQSRTADGFCKALPASEESFACYLY